MQQPSPGLSPHQKGVLLTSFGGILFTFDIPLLRLAGDDAWTLIFGRGVFLCLAITAWWFFWYRMRGHKMPFINGRAGLIVAVTNTAANLMFIAAVTMTTAANLVFILALNPILCAIIAHVFLGEKLHNLTWAAVIACFAGVAIIGADGLTTGTLPGDLMAFGVALMTAIALTVVRKSGKNVVSSLAVGSFASALIASFWAAPLALSFAGWGWLGLNGLIVIPLASALIALGPRYLPAPEVAMFFLLDTMLTPIWIWMIFAELPTPVSMLGGHDRHPHPHRPQPVAVQDQRPRCGRRTVAALRRGLWPTATADETGLHGIIVRLRDVITCLPHCNGCIHLGTGPCRAAVPPYRPGGGSKARPYTPN